jgi:hypothetical protein
MSTTSRHLEQNTQPRLSRLLCTRVAARRASRALLALLAGALLLTAPAQAQTTIRTWYVSTAGDDSHDCKTRQTACRNIQTAIRKANPGDTVSLAEGTYYENITIKKSLTLKGKRPRKTIIDGSQAGTVVDIPSNYQPTTAITISHVTIMNGYATAHHGGGIAFSSWDSSAIHATLTVEKSIIKNNRSDYVEFKNYGGGGIYVGYAALVVNDSIITGNVVVGDGNGAGILVDDVSAITVTNSLIADNHVLFSDPNPDGTFVGVGGGLAIGLARWATIKNSTIANNSSRLGGGLISAAYQGEITNTTFKGNSGPAVYFTMSDPPGRTISNSILHGSPACGGVPPTSAGYNIENGDSCGLDATEDKVNRAPGLKPLAYYGGFAAAFALKADSLAVDHGTCVTAPDQRGVARPQGPGCDIGAFEREAQ